VLNGEPVLVQLGLLLLHQVDEIGEVAELVSDLLLVKSKLADKLRQALVNIDNSSWRVALGARDKTFSFIFEH